MATVPDAPGAMPIIAFMCVGFRITIPLPHKIPGGKQAILDAYLAEMDRLHNAHGVDHTDYSDLVINLTQIRLWNSTTSRFEIYRAYVITGYVKHKMREGDPPLVDGEFIIDPRQQPWCFSGALAVVRNTLKDTIPPGSLKVAVTTQPFQVSNLGFYSLSDGVDLENPPQDGCDGGPIVQILGAEETDDRPTSSAQY